MIWTEQEDNSDTNTNDSSLDNKKNSSKSKIDNH